MPSRRASALCLFSALSTTSLAGCCREYWHGEVEPLDSPTQQRLHDVIAEQGRVAVGAGGTVVIGDELVTLDTTADLLAIAERNGEYGDARIAVGTGGTLAVQSDEGPWQLVPSPTSVDLVAVTADEHAFAVGDGVVVGYEFESGEAWLIAQGDGLAWGSLNAIVPAGGDRTLLLGDAGKAWMARGPLEGAVELELGVDVDLHAAGSHEDDGKFWILGDDGVALIEDGDAWTRVELDTDADFVDFSIGVALTSEGQLWDPSANELLVELPWARGIGETRRDVEARDGDPPGPPDIVIVGDEGQIAVLPSC